MLGDRGQPGVLGWALLQACSLSAWTGALPSDFVGEWGVTPRSGDHHHGAAAGLEGPWLNVHPHPALLQELQLLKGAY